MAQQFLFFLVLASCLLLSFTFEVVDFDTFSRFMDKHLEELGLDRTGARAIPFVENRASRISVKRHANEWERLGPIWG
ncbi:unnamed protein product [Caenorhabditis auriculariae]|uniref:Uncharacterized protein n=1 Tax=Caenorhabditis auriculariae TaxID=2777116 RepID=A0A8S1HP95_9PELO|nr:unnamed protein product [Caenorhabditis auriculariae]